VSRCLPCHENVCESLLWRKLTGLCSVVAGAGLAHLAGTLDWHTTTTKTRDQPWGGGVAEPVLLYHLRSAGAEHSPVIILPVSWMRCRRRAYRLRPSTRRSVADQPTLNNSPRHRPASNLNEPTCWWRWTQNTTNSRFIIGHNKLLMELILLQATYLT